MTKDQSKKALERIYLENAIKEAGWGWTIEKVMETPDFIIRDGEYVFGLEVVRAFAGGTSGNGANSARVEGDNKKKLDGIRRSYERQGGSKLSLLVSGNLRTRHLNKLVPALLEADFPNQPIGASAVIDSVGGLKIRATKGFYSRWLHLSDTVGWVKTGITTEIDCSIVAKASVLAKYKEAAGEDVRLLIVADSHYNSGKLSIDPNASFDHRGFSSIYFLRYPAEPPLKLRDKR